MKILVVLFLLIYTNTDSCSDKSTNSMDCNRMIAQEIADNKMRKMKYDLDQLSVEISEDSIYYQIEYLPLNKQQLGGGAGFKIFKKDCTIKEIQLYQ